MVTLRCALTSIARFKAPKSGCFIEETIAITQRTIQINMTTTSYTHQTVCQRIHQTIRTIKLPQQP